MEPTVFIYSLHDPETGHLRYVGKADNLKHRLTKHISKALAGKDFCHRSNWIRKLHLRGLQPLQFTIAEVPKNNWETWEMYFIKQARELGFDLVNGNEGGSGGLNPSDGVRKKISDRFKGVPLSDSHKEKLSLAKKGRVGVLSSRYGVPHSLETRLKYSLARAGIKRGPYKKKEKDVQGR